MITTLTGENDVLRQEALRQLTDEFVTKYTDMGLERLDGEEVEYARMHEAVQSLPFLAARKLIVLRTPGTNKEFTEKFEQLITDVAETNDVVLVEPKLDKRLSYYKQLRKLTDFHEFVVLDSGGLARYLVDYAKTRKGNLGTGDARTIIDRVGMNQLALQHELDKLLAYNPKVTRESIELLTDRTPQSNIFELLDAAFSGNTTRTMQLYDEQRELRVEPQQIVAMLIWQLHILAIVKAAGGRSADVVARDAKLSTFVVRRSMELARRITTDKLKQLIADLRVFDVRLKSEALNSDEVVRYYIIRLASGS
ncbi:MAG TPA: DNA polymerase III subunit delta [Verrucomicrobiae bacterium]|nr:DNA polymerase III subunit delta [Verrucomicrobiae bacterium]